MRPIAPTKAETARLEPFRGLDLSDIHVPTAHQDFADAAQRIIEAGVAGFDTESKPTFSVGEKNHGPHVVQFALRDRAYIFQLHRPSGREVAAMLLESDRVTKVGFGLQNDRGLIRSKFGVPPRAVVDLDQIFRRQGYAGQIGVRAAVGVVLRQSFAKSKSITTSNWASPNLTPRQLLYAANDAFAALRVMDALGLAAR